jgi:hypothetical protein
MATHSGGRVTGEGENVMLQVGVGISAHRDPRTAGRQAAEAAMKQAGTSSCDFVMMFATVGYPPEPLLQAVRAVTGNAPLSGCTGEGIIAQQVTNESNHAIVVMVWKSDELTFTNVKAIGAKKDSRGVGENIARSLGRVPQDAKALFVFADGITFNFDQFNRGFEGAVDAPRPVTMVGGTSLDNMLMKQMYQYHNGEVFNDGVSAALLTGRGSAAFQVNHGCVALGHERTITKSEGNVIFEIDDKPATTVLMEYLAPEEIDDAKSRSFLCMGSKAPRALAQEYDDYIIRYISQVDRQKGTITIQTDAVAGTKIWMTRRDGDKMSQGVEELGRRLKRDLQGKKPKAVFHFDCASRGSFMFPEDQKTKFITRLQEVFDPTVPWIGFYTSGEIAPVAGANYFHNFTVAITAIY